jgi:hypothetical protein
MVDVNSCVLSWLPRRLHPCRAMLLELDAVEASVRAVQLDAGTEGPLPPERVIERLEQLARSAKVGVPQSPVWKVFWSATVHLRRQAVRIEELERELEELRAMAGH